jgi:Xaa-Pro aminopeptidase
MTNRRDFLKQSGAVTVGAAIGSACAPPPGGGAARPAGQSASKLVSHPEHPEPAKLDRLPLEWHQATVKRLQEKLGERGLDGMLVTDRWNIIYFTGLSHTSTERPFACFIPTDALAVYWFHPGLDLELVRSWWSTEGGDYYYDYPHAEGAYPDQGTVVSGPAVDLLEWRLRGIEKLGYGEKKIGLSQPPTVAAMKRMTEVLPRAGFEDVSDVCVKMRRVKTAEELALSQRAYNYFSQIHAWTRDYILEHGTDLTDFRIRMAATE